MKVLEILLWIFIAMLMVPIIYGIGLFTYDLISGLFMTSDESFRQCFQ